VMYNPLRINSRGVAQPGSASALGAEGREFESHRPDQNNKKPAMNFFIAGFFYRSKKHFECRRSQHVCDSGHVKRT
jgi:hypothetical protein